MDDSACCNAMVMINVRRFYFGCITCKELIQNSSLIHVNKIKQHVGNKGRAHYIQFVRLKPLSLFKISFCYFS